MNLHAHGTFLNEAKFLITGAALSLRNGYIQQQFGLIGSVARKCLKDIILQLNQGVQIAAVYPLLKISEESNQGCVETSLYHLL